MTLDMERLRGRLEQQEVRAWVRDGLRVAIALGVLALAAAANAWLG